jgi:signal transduction histidine kinase
VQERTFELRNANLELQKEINERKALQDQLVRQEKLAVLGQLAGGVAHELLNPLGVIKNSVYFLNMILEKTDPEVEESLRILKNEVEISERVITSMLDFARANPPIQREVNIDKILHDIVSRANVPENIRVINQVAASLPAIQADPDQLSQVFGNIVLNAIQAMPEGGQLVIKSHVQGSDMVAISFTDTGVGIPQEDLDKIFEPLFTSKAKGIGLGMAISQTFVEKHGGTIDVQSEVGKGSTFTVKLPVHKK